MKRRERGVALITALLVVSLATIAAAAILTAANHSIHRAANLQDSEKAWWYAAGVEAWIKTILERDLDENKFDSLEDVWAKPVDYLPVDEGALRGSVVDLQGRFNVNTLGVADAQAFEKQRAVFLRLLQNLEGVDTMQAAAVASAIRDWVDKDTDPTGFDGAEDTEYLGVQPAYRVPNRYMESVTELLAVKGMTRELYAKLQCCVAALPQDVTPVNVNTAPEPLLRALVDPATPPFETFVRERAEKPAETLDPTVFGNTQNLTVQSQFFQLRAEIAIGSGRLLLNSTYFRPAQGRPVVIARSANTE